jgi:hypothetical protein
MFGSSGMRWGKTESKSNLGFRLGKAFTLLIRSKTDRRHRIVSENKLRGVVVIAVAVLLMGESESGRQMERKGVGES